MQMLKFGRLVDLDKLETVSVNRTVEELKEKLRQEELWSTRVVAKWDVCITCLYRVLVYRRIVLDVTVYSLLH